MEVYVIQNKNSIVMIIGVTEKNSMIWVLVKRVIYGLLVHMIASEMKHVKLINI